MQKKVCFALKLFMVWAVFNVMFYAVQGDFWGYGQLFIRVSLELIIFTLLIFNYQYFTRDLLSRMIMIWIVYSSVVTAYHSDYVAKDLSESLWWPLMYILFFLVGRYPKLLKTFIHKYVPVLIVLSFVMFFFTSRTKDGELTATNFIFYISLLMSFLFFYKGKKMLILFALCAFVSMLSFKRSAFLILLCMGVLFVYYNYIKTKNSNGILKAIAGVLVALAFIGAFTYLDRSNGGFFSERIKSVSDDEGSGHVGIYEIVMWNYSKLDSSEKLFGIGFNGVMDRQWVAFSAENVVSAHNDFLEMLCDFGIIGSVLYLIIIICMLRNVVRSRHISKSFFRANVACTLIFFVMSAVSQLFLYPTYFAYIVAIWAITQSILSYERKIKDIGSYSML